MDYECRQNVTGSETQTLSITKTPLSGVIRKCEAAIQNKTAGIKVKELKYFDLVADYNYSNGIYLFYSDSQDECAPDPNHSHGLTGAIMYIGKTTSRAVVDRVGSHLDLRVTGFLNCLVRGIAEEMIEKAGLPVSDCVTNGILAEGRVKDMIGDWYYIFIPVFNNSCWTSKEYAKKVARLESYLIKEIGPTYNFRKRKKQNNSNKISTP